LEFFELLDDDRVQIHNLFTSEQGTFEEKREEFINTYKIDGEVVDDIAAYYKELTSSFYEPQVSLFFYQQ